MAVLTVRVRSISRVALPLMASVVSRAAHAQNPTEPVPRPLTIEDALAVTQLPVLTGQAAAVSPDGEWVAYAACRVAKIKLDSTVRNQNTTRAWAVSDQMGCDIWLKNAATGRSRNLTRSKGNAWGPSWSPDGRFLAFYSDRGGSPQAWVWERRGGVLRRPSPAPARTTAEWEAPLWSPDGRHIVVKLRPRGLTDAQLEDAISPSPRGSVESGGAPGATVVVYRSPGISHRGPGVAADSALPRLVDNSWLGDLAIVDLRTGTTRTLARGVRTTCYLFSPDGSELAYLDSQGRLTEGDESIEGYYTRGFDLVVVSAVTGRSRVVSRDVRQWIGASLSWSPDGKWLAYVSGSATVPATYRMGYEDRGNLYIVPSAGGEPRGFAGAPNNLFENDRFGPLWDSNGNQLYLVGGGRVWVAAVVSGHLTPLTRHLAISSEAIVQGTSPSGGRLWSPDRGMSLYLMANDSLTKRSSVYRIQRATGKVETLREEDEYDEYPLHPPVGSADGRRVFYRAERANASQDLWVADPSFSQVRRLTALNPQFARYRLGKSRRVDFVNVDGQPLQAALLLPAGYVEGKRYPLVVWVYAGVYGSRQLNTFGLIGGPYNMQVLSTRGYAVLVPDIPVRLGRPVEDLVAAVIPAVDRVVSLGVADSQRLAVMGHSNGGYSTLALLTRTTRFKAAVMSSGFGNLPAVYGYMTRGGLAPWIPWLERVTGAMGVPPWEAPQRYVENSPIFYLDRVRTPLIIQVGGADDGFVPWNNEVFVGLRRLGREVTYLRYEGEGHALREVLNQTDYWNRVLGFFGEHMNDSRGDRAGQQTN